MQNQIWAGAPGNQALHSIGNNSAVEVWVKPLGSGRTAAFIINTQDKASDAAPLEAQDQSSPMLQLGPCNASSPSQQ